MKKSATTQTPAPVNHSPKQKIAALLVVYLKALMQSPGLNEAEYLAAEEHIKQITSAL